MHCDREYRLRNSCITPAASCDKPEHLELSANHQLLNDRLMRVARVVLN